MFDSFVDVLADDTWDEVPVPLKEFIESPQYMNLGDSPLSELQMHTLEAMTQILYPETIEELYRDTDSKYCDYLKSLRIREVIAMVGKGCVTGDSWMLTDRGWKRAKDVGIGKVWTHNGFEGSTGGVLVDTDRCLTVKTNHGYEITAHDSHALVTKDGWKSAKELNVGDRMAISIKPLPTPGIDMTLEEARWVGYMYGDGSFPSSKPRSRPARLTNVTPEVFNDWIQITESKSPVMVKTEMSGYGASRFVASGPAGRGKNPWTDFCRKWGLENAKDWNDEFYNMSAEQVGQFMVGLIATDGSINKWGAVDLGISNEGVMKGVQKLLLNIGVPSRLASRSFDNPNHKDNWRMYIEARHADKIWAAAGMKFPGKEGSCGDNPSTEEIYFTEVTEIIDAGAIEIYDFMVNPSQTYVANGFINHNGGKNHISTLAVCRVVYLLLCMSDPAKYYGKPTGNDIALLNVAVNSDQAKNAFFVPLTRLIRNAPWFRGKYDDSKQGVIRFAPGSELKNITAYSGHSQREAWEGFNFIFIILDEIAAFKTASESTSSDYRADTAPALYDAYRAAVTSRFGNNIGKLCLLSFPRFKGDFITERYNEVAVDIERFEYAEDFPIDPQLPMEGGNKLRIEWYEEEVKTYKEPFVMALRAPSWKFNPTKTMGEYAVDFSRNMIDSLSRFACNPPDTVDSFFTDRERVEQAFSQSRHPFTDNWEFIPTFVGNAEIDYYMHVDLAQKSDRAAISIAHVEDWMEIGSGLYRTVEPIIKIDAVRWWTPTPGRNVDFTDVKDFIDAVKRRGFSLKRVTFDRWAGSVDLQTKLARDGVEVETLSVGRQEYNAFQTAVYDKRLRGYKIPLLTEEIMGLRVDDKGRIDHTAAGSNDLADAVAGSAFLCMKYVPRPAFDEIEVRYLDEIDTDEGGVLSLFEKKQDEPRPVSEERPREMPSEVQLYLDSNNVI